jgi:hypothetical protein
MRAVWFVACVLWLLTDGVLCLPPSPPRKPVVMWHGMGMYDISFQFQVQFRGYRIIFPSLLMV